MAEQQGEFDEDDNEDPNNSGAHINDAHNRPDEQGRVMVNVGHPPDEPPVYLAPQLSRAVKPHQIGGIRFLYDNLVESIERYKISNGFGCILAHSMGLGKTIQVISFIDVFLRTTEAKRVLCIVPVNTLQNWVGEFNMWLPDKKCLPDDTPEQEVLPRQFNIHIINDTHKTPYSRAAVVENWYKIGGVLLLGYEMYRLLTSRRIIKKRMSKKKAHLPVVIDLEEEDRNQELIVDMQACLVTPGPDLIICDEGHRIKNAHASISQALKNIQTRRRVVLTGYPLQNNLIEYWCMVDFVRPSFLGNKTEFANMFERPITNGQCADATDQDKRLMKFRAHVLHSLLEGFVQRRGHAVLRSSLPVKHEYVLMVRMSPIQRQLYNRFMEVIEDPNMFGNNPLKAFAVCCKIWNHPDIIQEIVKAHKENDFDLDLDEGSRSNDGTAKKKTATTKSPKSQSPYFPGMEGLEPPPGLFGPEKSDGRITYEWAEDLLRNYVRGDINNGGKMQLLLNILEESVMVGDKMLLFSQSLFTLNLIEEYLGKSEVPLTNDKWAKNRNYFRLDGSTSASERDKLINQFNDPQNTNVQLFLLSTRAGCLGINLIGANRVIIFDASWNPCHDCQAVCRVYRYGQTKETFVYRFVTDNTLERRIYERQINKQGMSDRVVDELNPQNHFTKKQVETLLQYQDVELPLINFNNFDGVCHDPLLLNVLKRDGHWITKEPFTHESLLVDNKEQKLTKSEKRLAKQGYEYEKKMNTTYSRPSYSTWYPKTSTGANPNLNISRSTMPGLAGRLPSRHIPSVKPLQSAPIPMQPSFSDSGPPINVQSLQRPGVHVQQIITTTDITIPGTTSSTTSGPQKVPAGSQVLVIKTPRGVYIRTGQGKIFAVRSAPNSKGDSTPPLGGATGSTTSTTTTYSDGDSLASSGDRPLSLTTNSSKSKSMLTNLLEQSSGIRDMMNGVSNEEKSADGQSPSSDLKNYDDTPKSEQIINHQTLSGGETIVAPSVTQHKKQHPFDMDSLLSQQQTGNGDSSQPHSSHADGGDMYSKYDNMRNSPFGGFPSNPYSFPGFSNPLPPSYPYPQNVPLPPWPGFPQSIPSTDTKQTPEKK
ncbi:unnamed protein product [Owenia fusiformis]|uniref:Uncharacterized protein n=1 Tax=Owenia fusiformis TaxID=6347 RepID=A0A8J1T871_OWEFU|nr:unnamed protein product [Owenia fusiformis]